MEVAEGKSRASLTEDRDQFSVFSLTFTLRFTFGFETSVLQKSDLSQFQIECSFRDLWTVKNGNSELRWQLSYPKNGGHHHHHPGLCPHLPHVGLLLLEPDDDHLLGPAVGVNHGVVGGGGGEAVLSEGAWQPDRHWRRAGKTLETWLLHDAMAEKHNWLSASDNNIQINNSEICC